MNFLIMIIIIVFSAPAFSYKVIESIDCSEFFNTTEELKIFLKVSKGENGGYDLAVSSRDTDVVPFGLVAFAPGYNEINDKCSAQLIDFLIEPITGDLYAKDRFGKLDLIATPKEPLPQAHSLGEIFEIFREYQLSSNVSLINVHHELRRKRKITGRWWNREVYYYNYKNLNLIFKINNQKKYYSSF